MLSKVTFYSIINMVILFFIINNYIFCQTNTTNTSSKNNPFEKIRPGKPTIFYIHVGAGFCMPGLFFSKDIDKTLTNTFGGTWRIHHIDFPGSLSASTGISNILRVEYQKMGTLFRHDIKYASDIIGTNTGNLPPIYDFERVYETWKMKYRSEDILFMFNPFFNMWMKNATEEKDKTSSTAGIYIIYGFGKIKYIDKEYNVFTWKGSSKVYGIGLNGIGKTAGFGFSIKYHDINFEITPFDIILDQEHKASYISLHFSYYIGIGL